MNRAWCGVTASFLVISTVWAGNGFAQTASSVARSVVAPGAKLERVQGEFIFTEGPVTDPEGNVYFTDSRKKRIYIWSIEEKLSVFLEDPRGAVGLDFDRNGSLLAASTAGRAVLSINLKDKKVSVLADSFHGKRLNSPNDLWCDPKGGVYFTDPRFVTLPYPKEQETEGVYYLSPDRTRLIRVIGDLGKPNGVVGSPDGKFLYVDDTPEDKTYIYTINPDGTLSNKRLFAPTGNDGLTLDSDGNVYITSKGVDVYTPAGKKIETIPVSPQPTNVCFGGRDGRTLFITARTAAFTLRMRTRGIAVGKSEERQ